jgi:hypothetical protein
MGAGPGGWLRGNQGNVLIRAKHSAPETGLNKGSILRTLTITKANLPDVIAPKRSIARIFPAGSG